MGIWRDGIVPLAMEGMAFDVDGSHLGISDDDAFGVLRRVQLASHSEASFGGGSRDQFDDHAIADEGLGTPVLADEGEETVLDFVPLAGARRQVADRDVDADFIGQRLQFAFPQPHARAVAAATVSRDHQAGCLGIARPTDSKPPLADAVDRERSRVVVDTDADPAMIGRKIIDPVRYGTAEFLDQEVMDPDLFRVSLRAILPSGPANARRGFL